MTEELITAQDLGRRGGKKTAEIYGSDHYRKIQAKGVETKLKRKLARLQAQTTS